MTFLEDFSWAFQDIVLKSKEYEKGKYGENIKSGESIINFKGIIQEKGGFSEKYYNNQNLEFTSKDFELRSPVEIKPKKGDIIEYNSNQYDVIYSDIVLFDGKIDHNITIIRLIN